MSRFGLGTQVAYDRAPHRVPLLLCRPRDLMCDGTKSRSAGRTFGVELGKLDEHRVLVRATRLVRSKGAHTPPVRAFIFGHPVLKRCRAPSIVRFSRGKAALSHPPPRRADPKLRTTSPPHRCAPWHCHRTLLRETSSCSQSPWLIHSGLVGFHPAQNPRGAKLLRPFHEKTAHNPGLAAACIHRRSSILFLWSGASA